MLMITDCPNTELKEQGRNETINWIKMRKEAAKKFKSSSLHSHQRTSSIPKMVIRKPSKEGKKVLLAHESQKPIIGPLTAEKKSETAKKRY